MSSLLPYSSAARRSTARASAFTSGSSASRSMSSSQPSSSPGATPSEATSARLPGFRRIRTVSGASPAPVIPAARLSQAMRRTLLPVLT